MNGTTSVLNVVKESFVTTMNACLRPILAVTKYEILRNWWHLCVVGCFAHFLKLGLLWRGSHKIRKLKWRHFWCHILDLSTKYQIINQIKIDWWIMVDYLWMHNSSFAKKHMCTYFSTWEYSFIAQMRSKHFQRRHQLFLSWNVYLHCRHKLLIEISRVARRIEKSLLGIHVTFSIFNSYTVN